MNRDSIIFSVTAFFVVALLSIIAFFGILLVVEHTRDISKNEERIFRAVKTTNTFVERGLPLFFLQEQLKDLKVELLDPTKIKLTLDNAKTYKEIKRGTSIIKFYRVANQNYIEVLIKGSRIMIFEDLQSKANKKMPLLLIGLILSSSILILSYLAVLRKIRPLKKLEKNIKKFGEGNLEISTKSSGNDEISRLANSFDKAISNINKLKKSREFFLRNIMHELKTPITKGKITTALLEDSSNKERLSRVFNRLELLINEFACIERIIAGAKEENIKEYRVVDLIDGARDLLFEQGEIKIGNISKSITVDYNLFTVALKNIIENAFKHSKDRTIFIEEKENKIEFSSFGKPLKKSLEEYIKPFEKDNSDGFGLGLYIIDTVLKHHNYKLEYSFDKTEEKNIFFFTL